MSGGAGLTPEQLAAGGRVLAVASDGPWTPYPQLTPPLDIDHLDSWGMRRADGSWVWLHSKTVNVCASRGDSEFIAWARESAAALIATAREVDTLRAASDALAAALADARGLLNEVVLFDECTQCVFCRAYLHDCKDERGVASPYFHECDGTRRVTAHVQALDEASHAATSAVLADPAALDAELAQMGDGDADAMVARIQARALQAVAEEKARRENVPEIPPKALGGDRERDA